MASSTSLSAQLCAKRKKTKTYLFLSTGSADDEHTACLYNKGGGVKWSHATTIYRQIEKLHNDNLNTFVYPSDNQQQQNPEIPANEDLEDGEIEDDDEEEEEQQQQPATVPVEQPSEPAPDQPPSATSPIKFPQQRPSRFDRHRYDERKRGHLTEAEKSVMHLHKIERLEREKRDRYKRDQTTTVDDFASNIEKAIANVLRKDKKRSDDEKEDEDKRGKKRKRKDKDKKKVKQQKSSPKPEDVVDESEMLNVHGASPQQKQNQSRSPTPNSDYDSYESSTSSEGRDRKRREKRKTNKDKKYKERNREQKSEPQLKDAQGVCVFYLQGKCTKENNCPYSHEVSQPIKLELCKFYLMGCCAKGENCHYMHSEFPCKFYHTGLSCYAGDTCKFAHGKPLEEGLRQILFKHIETAPKEILGDFPRLSREGALTMINQAQKALEVKYGVESGDSDKASIPSLFELNIPVPAELLQKDDSKTKEKNEKQRNRPSRWQDPDPIENSDAKPNQMHLTFGLKGFYSERGDQDMRVNSNGDIDMRTLPPRLNLDTDIRNSTQDTDIRLLNLDNQVDFSKDIDIRQIPQFTNDDNDNMADEPNLEIDEGHEDKTETKSAPAHLPKKQRELFLRIKAQQKDNLPDTPKEAPDEDTNNIDWYSDDDDDDDDGRLTIRDDVEEVVKPKVEEPEPVAQPLQIKPVEVIEKLGDLSKIDISAEVTKMLLSSISQSGVLNKEPKAVSPRDPRTAAQTDTKPALVAGDPRRSRVDSTDTKKQEKLSIYDQGCIPLDQTSKDVDLRAVEDLDLRPKFGDTDLRTPLVAPTSGRPDIDLRQLGLPFKAMQNYTPASEIDASLNSHVPITWRVHLVDIPRPDYTGLKLSQHEAQNTGDPRLRKIFRLNSTEEKDSPASPKETPKPTAPTTPTVRIDPRRRKMEEKPVPNLENPSMSYSQQLNVLQTSAFYQSLTSNQKVLLNQELSSKHDNSGNNDQTLNGILSNLGLLSGPSTIIPTANNASALNILANINSLNPLITQAPNMIVSNQPFVNQNVNPNILSQNPNVVNQMAQSIVQPGLLGAAPGVPNLPPDFQLNFDPRQGGLLGNAPNFNYNENQNYNFNEEYYEEGNNFIESNRGRGGNRGGFRDRQHQRRGRSFNNRNAGGRNFRNRNRSNNRSRTPP
ncbi:hypothetical protein FQR65_LT11961 [Abscondita terminalis]|nr:hypothetical protein FQR65_LT11961 [Abscondita terminalis]